jgi:ACDE family multidrug resistance protein
MVRPRAVNSAGYNFLRWLGGAAKAILVGPVAAEWYGNISAPFWAAAACSLVAAGMLLRKHEAPADPHSVPADAAAIGAD